MIYLTSDQHFYHARVIEYCDRPYRDVEEMNEALVLNWNNVVKPEDTVICLGDFSMAFRPVETFSQRLMGKKILVPGNHDWCHSFHKKSRTIENQQVWLQKYADHGWEVWDEQAYLQPFGSDELLLLCHHPYSDNSGTDEGDSHDKYDKWRPVDDGTILLNGHVHEKWKTKRSPKGTLQINVGVDVWGMAPVSLATILELIEQEKK